MRLDQSSLDVATLVEKVRRKELDLQPDFQRGQIWSDGKKKRLIDTILRQWYVPAIHIVVNDSLDREEVLDGQQRLRSILEFMNDEFTVDGALSPVDEKISSLGGLKYSELPVDVRSRFRRFTITTVRLRDYGPEEPGELFFRLNQISALSAAEQRNALIGEPRNQVRRLRSRLTSKVSNRDLGFTNARMNYDDVLARLAFTVESGALDMRLTAGKLEKRYRSGSGFAVSTINAIESAIDTLADAIPQNRTLIKLNKATLFTWLFFIYDHEWLRGEGRAFFRSFFSSVEYVRASSPIPLIEQKSLYRDELRDAPAARSCLSIFNDRASSRVNDTSSIALRDLCLNVCAYIVPDSRIGPMLATHYEFLSNVTKELAVLSDDATIRAATESRLAQQWEAERAKGSV